MQEKISLPSFFVSLSAYQWVFKMVLYPLLPAKALCVIIKHKSISSFELYNSDSRVKQAMALSFYKAAANRSLGYTRCYLSLFSRILGKVKHC